MNTIEPLELRIAPAAVFTYTDLDGDLVTITTSKGDSAALGGILVFSSPDPANSRQLRVIDFSQDPGVFAGTNLSITAKARGGGDGLVNVGFIDASATNGGTAIDLGTVSIKGDLGSIRAGDGAVSAADVKSLNARSLGRFGLATQGGVGDLGSGIAGRLGALTVTGDVRDVNFQASTGVGAITIGGSLIGGATPLTGWIFGGSGGIGPVKISGDMVGGAGSESGTLRTTAGIASLTVKGSVIGGGGDLSGAIVATGGLGAVSIGRDVVGGSGADSGQISTPGDIASLAIGGSLLGGAGARSGQIAMDDSRAVKIGRNVVGGDGLLSASLEVKGKLISLTIRGSVIGGKGSSSAELVCGDESGLIKIGGDVLGGAGTSSAAVYPGLNTAGVSIGGSLRGSASASGIILSLDAIGPVKVGGDVSGAAGFSGQILSRTSLASVSIGRSLVGGAGEDSGIIHAPTIGAVSIGGSVVGGAGQDSGGIGTIAGLQNILTSDIGKITIKGSLFGGAGERSGRLDSDDEMGAVKIGGEVVGGSAIKSGYVFNNGTLTSLAIGGSLRGGGAEWSGALELSGGTSGPVTIGGSIFGGSADSTGYLYALDIGAIIVKGDLLGGSISGAVSAANTGVIDVGDAESIIIGGSIIAGSDASTGSLSDSGAIFASTVGALTVKGSILGSATNRAQIGLAAVIAAVPGLALGSLTVGGDVERADIVVGSSPAAVNANIGPVKIGGDWIASTLAAGALATNAYFGDGDDELGNAGTFARIASITIRGTVLGSGAIGDHFGFVAAEIGSFKSLGFTAALLAGVSNDVIQLSPITSDVTIREVED